MVNILNRMLCVSGKANGMVFGAQLVKQLSYQHPTRYMPYFNE